MERHCENCGNLFTIDPINLERGWGICCSESCATAHQKKKTIQSNISRAKATTTIGSGVGMFAVIMACVSLIDGEYMTALLFFIGGAVGMVLIAKFSR